MNEINYTNLLAAFNINGAHPGSLEQTKQVLQPLNVNKHSKVLDVGCGTGQTVAYLKQAYDCEVHGLDANEHMLKLSKNKLDSLKLSVNVVKGSVENLPYQDHSFDFILSESVTAFTKIRKALKEYKRVLRENGLLVMNEMTRIGDLDLHEQQEIKEFYGFSEILTEDEWIKLIQDAGFKPVSSQNIDLFDNRVAVELEPFDIINDQFIDMLLQHQYLISKYKTQLGAKIYIGKA